MSDGRTVDQRREGQAIHEGRYGIVVWPADAKKWRGRVGAPAAQECVTIRWESLPRTTVNPGRDRGRYVIRFHSDGFELRMHRGLIGAWLMTREARRMPFPESGKGHGR